MKAPAVSNVEPPAVSNACPEPVEVVEPDGHRGDRRVLPFGPLNY
jgi:hypothetical protein